MRKRRLYLIAATLILVLQIVPFLGAQQRNNGTPNVSELALQNLSHVAASPAEIKSVLLKDTGLLVELKRWVAKDATDHGQVVTDMDLTNDSIFDRLETDVQFRSMATALLQRFGYLIPNLNPNSDVAKEHELLVQERTKWLAQNQEEELTKARQAETRNLQFADSCDVQNDTDCNSPQTPRSTSKGARQDPQQPDPPTGTVPGERNPSNPPSAGGNTLMRAQLTQTDPDSAAQFAQNPMLDAYDSGSSPNIQNVNSFSEPMTPQRRGPNTGMSPGAGSANGESNPASNTDGLLAAYGSGMGTNASNRESSDARGMDGPGASRSTGSLAISPAFAMQPSNRRFPSAAISEPSEMMRKAGPYNDIPSLYDMYVQAVTRPASPRRFGAEIFENGTRDSQLIPMDLPVGPDYVVGPGDGLSVDLWGGISQRLYRTVDREGRVSLPEVGPILVSGKSLAAVQESVQQIMRTQFRDVSADVSLSRLRTIRIYEVGDIVKPGAYDIASLSTPLNALFVAGGPTQRGSMRILKHYRGTQLVETVDVYDLVLHGVKTDLQRLENGDTVQVPPIGPQVTVEGMVRRPAIYELRDEKSLASVLELAGGLLPAAALRHIEVQRMVAHDKQTMLSLDIPEIESAAEVTKKFESFEIQDGDRIRIYPIVPYNQDTVFIQGHVVRPGRYSFREGMRVTDLLSSYKDLLPEPAAQYAEIIRLNAPDFHPSVESFDLGDALANPSKAPVLHALDTVRIFSRFDFENPPSVSVLGDVRFPGTYQTPGQIHLADAVHVAGGLTPNAQTADAQVFRTLPDGKFKVFSVNLSQALGGDPVENIILQSHDRLLIHKNPDAVEPSTVYIRGEVGKPGRYPLATNMQVADLIRIGGGLKPSADTQEADLTKYDYSNPSKLTGQHEVIALAAALAGNSNSNEILHNGDVLTIRQLPGWNDLGASIAVRGEVKHPGTYGIRPGERLSAVLERTGGFQGGAYPYGAILQRVQVRELEVQSQNEIILRVKGAQSSLELLPDTDAKQKEAKLQAIQQWQTTLDQLNSNPPPGRVTIRISSKIDQWKNTAADIEVRAGDVLVVPKRPSYVMVTGQVFNPTAVSFRPGKSAKWYLDQSGGPTQVAYKKAIFVVRADGAVAGSKSNFLVGESLNFALQPGDTIVVPEKALGGTGLQWQTVMLLAQTASAIASTVIIALHY
jgi:protein involved in polysaccharide export with SLBB domain